MQIEHIIIFMQENRAYDHVGSLSVSPAACGVPDLSLFSSFILSVRPPPQYYGMHAGVRGFNDRTAIQLPSGLSSFYQPVDQKDLGLYMLPFHTSTMTTSAGEGGDGTTGAVRTGGPGAPPYFLAAGGGGGGGGAGFVRIVGTRTGTGAVSPPPS